MLVAVSMAVTVFLTVIQMSEAVHVLTHKSDVIITQKIQSISTVGPIPISAAKYSVLHNSMIHGTMFFQQPI